MLPPLTLKPRMRVPEIMVKQDFHFRAAKKGKLSRVCGIWRNDELIFPKIFTKCTHHFFLWFFFLFSSCMTNYISQILSLAFQRERIRRIDHRVEGGGVGGYWNHSVCSFACSIVQLHINGDWRVLLTNLYGKNHWGYFAGVRRPFTHIPLAVSA